MAKSIFVNLPVGDLPRSRSFYLALGTRLNAQFSNDMAACIVFSDTISVMLLTHDFYESLSSKPISDSRTTSQVLICITVESREEVDAMLSSVAAAGGTADPSPLHDESWMYGRSFEDPDGHLLQIMWMDAAAMPSVTA